MVEKHILTAETQFTSHAEAARALLDLFDQGSATPVLQPKPEPKPEIEIANQGGKVTQLHRIRLRLAFTGSALGRTFPDRILTLPREDKMRAQPTSIQEKQDVGTRIKLRIIFYEPYRRAAEVWAAEAERHHVQCELIVIKHGIHPELNIRQYIIEGDGQRIEKPYSELLVPKDPNNHKINETTLTEPLNVTEVAHTVPIFHEFMRDPDDSFQLDLILGSAKSIGEDRVFRIAKDLVLPNGDLVGQQLQVSYDPGTFQFYQIGTR